MTSNHINQRIEKAYARMISAPTDRWAWAWGDALRHYADLKMNTPLEIANQERRCAKRGAYPLLATSGVKNTLHATNDAIGAV